MENNKNSGTYKTIAIAGVAGSGKSVLCGRLAIEESVPIVDSSCGGVEKFRVVSDKTKPEKELGHSNMTSYLMLPFACDKIELVVVPGIRKFWKWVDFGFSDADGLVVVIRPTLESGEIKVSELIEPVVTGISFGFCDFMIVIHNIDEWDETVIDKVVESINVDLNRIFGSHSFPVIVISRNPTLAQLEALRSHLVHIKCLRPTAYDPLIPQTAFQLSMNEVRSVSGKLVVGGKILSGSVAVGDSLLVQPGGIPVTVESIHVEGKLSVTAAVAGQVAGIMLTGVTEHNVSTGMVLTSKNFDLTPSVGQSTRRVIARINLFNLGNGRCTSSEFRIGMSPIVSIMNAQAHSRVVSLEQSTDEGDDSESLSFELRERNQIGSASIGGTVLCEFAFNKSVFAAVHRSSNPSPFSRIRVRLDNTVIAVGVIVKVCS